MSKFSDKLTAFLSPTWLNSVEEHRFGFIRMKPHAEAVRHHLGIVYISTSEGWFDTAGLYVLRITELTYYEQPNGDLIYRGVETHDEFYKRYPLQGYKLHGRGTNGVVEELAADLRTK